MTKPVNIDDAKTKLSRLAASRPKPAARKPGRLRGRIRIRKNFDTPLPSDLLES